MYTCILRHVQECLCMYEVSRKLMMEYWGQIVETVGQRVGVSRDHPSKLRIWKTRRLEHTETGPTPRWSVPLSHFSDITLPQLLPPFHCDPAPPILCLFFSHCWSALQPAMLPWEPAGDGRHPLHLFSFILFWKWIKCLSWKVCPDSRVLKFIHSKY